MVNIAGLFFQKKKNVLYLLMLFQKLDESKCNPNKTWVDKSSEFCDRLVNF